MRPHFPKRLRVSVTQTDIEEGERADCYTCPIALAAARTMKNRGVEGVVRVTEESLVVYPKGDPTVGYRSGTAVAEFISKFDTNRQVEPQIVNFYKDEGYYL